MLPDTFIVKSFEVTGWGGVEDVDAVHGQQLVGVLDQLVHVLVVLACVLVPAKINGFIDIFK